MRKRILIVAALLLAAEVLGCGKQASRPAAQQTGKKIVLGYTTMDLSNPFWVRVQEGMKKAADESGIELKVFDAQNKPQKQLTDVEDMVQKRFDAVLISPVDSDSAVPAVKAANEAGIPVVVVDIGVNGGQYDTLIISDNHLGGKLAGEYMAKRMKAGDKVAHIQCQLAAVNAQKRGEGFEAAMQAAGMKVAAKQPADSKRDLALTVMENILQKSTDLQGVFCQNDNMALGASKAIRERNLGSKIMVMGFDGNKDALEAIKAGTLLGTVAQQPEEMGRIAVRSAADILAKKPVKKRIEVPVVLITKENVGEFLR